MQLRFAPLILALAFVSTVARAAEPNETFATRTFLSEGILSVLDDLAYNFIPSPDTYLGNRDAFAEIEYTDDNSSPYGDGGASALYDIPTHFGEIEFAVTGVGDDIFEGFHTESGGYEVFVNVYDDSDVFIDTFSSGFQTLEEGEVDEFYFENVDWFGGSYDVEINNIIIPPADLDFYTFTGLTAGMPFAARTSDPDELFIDTFLGWFDDNGVLIDDDDDGAGGFLSLIEGIVPESGELTFAVTGFGDNEFAGDHEEVGTYGLELELDPQQTLIGDYNGDGKVSAADFTVWRDNIGASTLTNRDPENFGSVNVFDFESWMDHYGETDDEGAGAFANVPEPGSVMLAGCAMLLGASRRRSLAAAKDATEVGI